MSRFKKYDNVRLSVEYDNQSLYIVAETSSKNIVSLFPKRGGFGCAAHEDNLVLAES